MKRALVLLTHRKQSAWLARAVRQYLDSAESVVVCSVTPAARLREPEVRAVGAIDARYLDVADIDMARDHRELSKIATELIRAALRKISSEPSLREMSTYEGISLIETQGNSMYTFGYRIIVAAIERIVRVIEQEKPDVLVAFSTSKTIFHYPERPDIEILYDNELTYAYLIRAVAKELNLDLRLVDNVSTTTAVLKVRLRAFLMRSYKLCELFRRALRDRRHRKAAVSRVAKGKLGIAILIRAASEYWTIQPAIERLRARGDVELFLLQDDIIKDPSARTLLEQTGEAFVPIHAFTTPLDLLRSFIDGVRRSGTFDRGLADISLECSPAAHQDTIHARILGADGVFAREVSRSMSKRFSEELIFVKELGKFIEIYRPSLLVTMSMVDNWGALVAETGKKYGIKTLSIQNAARAFLALPTMIFADRFAVASRRQRDGLVDLGADPHRIAVTGIPQYDPYLSGLRNRAPMRCALDVAADQKLVLITTQPTGREENAELIEVALKALAEYASVTTLIKLHPRERLADYGKTRELIDAKRYRARLVHQQNVLELISAADLMLSRVSTTIQSALMIGTPVIAYISKANEHAERDYLDTEAVSRIPSTGELPDLIRKWMTDYAHQMETFLARRSDYLAEGVGVADGRASERVLNLVDEMIGGQGQ